MSNHLRLTTCGRRLCLLLVWALYFIFDNAVASPTAHGANSPAAETGSSERKTTTDFDGERALRHVYTQVSFGPRPSGSPALEKTREYLVRELQSYGVQVRLDVFTSLTPHGKVKMKNIVAELVGETSNLIVIASHYDTKHLKNVRFLGANDGGSSTAALLEIARVMASRKQKSRFTYQFVFFDGEEAFCEEWDECLHGSDNTYGSRYMVERLRAEKRLHHVKAMILLDMIGDRELTIAREAASSPWLVSAFWNTAGELGYTEQFVDRSYLIEDDHVPFLKAGIPAVNIIDFEYGKGPQDNRYWHTSDDTPDKISARSLKIVGDVVLLSLPRIEAHKIMQ